MTQTAKAKEVKALMRRMAIADGKMDLYVEMEAVGQPMQVGTALPGCSPSSAHLAPATYIFCACDLQEHLRSALVKDFPTFVTKQEYLANVKVGLGAAGTKKKIHYCAIPGYTTDMLSCPGLCGGGHP